MVRGLCKGKCECESESVYVYVYIYVCVCSDGVQHRCQVKGAVEDGEEDANDELCTCLSG